MLDDDDEYHSYQYLLDSIERYQQKTKKAKNLDGLTNALLRKDQAPPAGNPPKGKNKAANALAAKLEEQCKFHLMPNGCNWPDTCKLGRHDPEFRGKGTKGAGKGGDKGAAKGKAKGDKSKGKSDTKPGGKGGDTKATGNPAKLPDDALVDSEGKSFCYAFIHGKCNDPIKCGRYHGPETPAMQKKRLKDEKKIAESAAQAGSPKSATAQPKGAPTANPKAKPTPKSTAAPAEK